MVSNIDPSKPITGIDQPVQVIRDNFAITKVEIEELQANKLNRTGDNMLGVLGVLQSTTAGLPSPAANKSGLVFNTDTNTLSFSDGLAFLDVATVGNIVDAFRVDFTPPPSPTTILSSDSIIILGSGIALQEVFLPPAFSIPSGKTITLTKGFGTPSATVTPAGLDVIDGFGTGVQTSLLDASPTAPPNFPSGFKSIKLSCDGVNTWYIVSSTY